MNQWETRRGRPALADLHEIDAVCDRFEEAWRSGQRPDIAEFLADVPVNTRAQLFRDLLSLDLEYRRRLGEQPEAQSYCERFPEFAAPAASALAPLSSQSTNIRGEGNNSVSLSDHRTIRKSWHSRHRSTRILPATSLGTSTKPASKSWASSGVVVWAWY